jgi:proteic killer suppression protein
MLYLFMIKSFRSKALAELWNEGKTRRIAPVLQKRVKTRLSALHRAKRPEDMNVQSFDFHVLHGVPKRYTVHVNGPWCITFGWDGGEAVQIDLEQYH